MLYLRSMTFRRSIAGLFLLVLFASAESATAALPIDLEIATEPSVPLAAPQEWARMLGRMDLGSVRIRGARAGDQPTVEQQQLGGRPRYRVRAMLTGRNELVLPKRRFRATQRAALQKYFEELPAKTAYQAEERGRFGLTEKQFRSVYAELSVPLGFSTKELTPAEVLKRAEKNLATPLQRSGKLRSHKRLEIELQDFSTGTALAFALRADGLALRPEQLPSELLQLVIAPLETTRETWPVGWRPTVSARQSAPHLFESRNIEISGFTLTQALTALQPALRVPVVIDPWALEHYQIDPSKVEVTLAKQRTFLKSAVGKLLSQAKLVEEVRVDEQEQPFLWITRFGKNSPTATK